MSSAYILILFFVFLLQWYFQKKARRPLPPGPRGLPFVGNLFQIKPQLHLQLQKWGEIYGKIFSIRLGFETIVIINDHKVMREMFNKPEFCGRPTNAVLLSISDGNFGIINTEGVEWERQRRFTLRSLKDLGLGIDTEKLERLIMTEIQEMIDFFRQRTNQSISLNRKFSIAVLNPLSILTFGKRFFQNDPKLLNMLETTISTFDKISETWVLLFAPWIRHWFPQSSGWNSLQIPIKRMTEFFKNIVSEHKKSHQPTETRDFVDLYLRKIMKTQDPRSSFFGEAGYKNLTAIVGDLFLAGSETTSNTMEWAMLYISSHPPVQLKLQKVIDNIIGNSPPKLSDRQRMPYAECIIYEIMRHSSLLPLGVFHSALETTYFHSYHIPKGTWLIGNLYAVHHNPHIWEDHEHFRPERFLKENGTLNKHEAFIPFQTGRRKCLGGRLAMDTLFLFITTIFQNFSVQLDENFIQGDFQPFSGFLRRPPPFNVVINERIPIPVDN